MAASKSARALQFGEFRLDLQALELTRGGTKIRVPEQSLQILAMLLERPGEVVTREELHAKLWPNGTIVEFEHSINAAMNRLRAALGDSADEPRFVETLPRRGYRFIFPVEPQAPVETPDTPTSGELIGQTISHYRVLQKLGQGAMGVVYKAEDLKLGRKVALKFLTEELSDSPQARERFQREARAVSSLNHPHICTLHDIGHQDGVDFLVMEYLEGETLAHRLLKGPLAADQVLQFAIQITGALDAAHRHGVIHRDLKPGNIMLTKSGAKLLDFGLAKVRVPEVAAGMTALPTETALTGEGTLLGTLQYMAPEQLEGKEADARTDIFALGAVLYEMATGRKAFEGKSQASLISAILTAEPPPISTLQSMAPPLLDHVVRACLAKAPDARWQSAHDVLVELQWIAGSGTVPQVSAPAGVARHRKRERIAWIVAGCSLAALILAMAMVYLRPSPEARVVQFEVTLPGKAASERLVDHSVSPDGQYVAMIIGAAGHEMIWLRPLNSRTTNPLPGTEGVQWFSWSPNSRQIAFSTASALKKISITGESPQTVRIGQVMGAVAWNRDDVILFGPGENQPLHRVSANGGEPKPVTRLNSSRQETGHYFPQFLPDGQHFIYLAWCNKPENIATYLGSLDSQEVKRIHDGDGRIAYAPPGYLIFLDGTSLDALFALPSLRGRDGWWGGGSDALMAQRFNARRAEFSGDPMLLVDSVATAGGSFGIFSVSEKGALTYVPGASSTRTEMVWVDRSGKRLGTLGEPGEYSNPAISPDQKMIAVGKGDPQTDTRDIWVFDVQRGASLRLTFDPADDFNPTWSPDGTRIAFTSSRKGHGDIYVKPASGVGEEQVLAQSEENKYIEDWSADGQYVVSGTDTTGGEQLYSFRDHKTVTFLSAKFLQDQCRFSPNRGGPPRWVACSSNETGARQVYVHSFAAALSGSGGEWQISFGGGSEPMWRGDGKELYYMEGNKLMAVEVNGDGESFQAGTPRELFEARVRSEQLRNHYLVTADGKRFLMNTPVEGQERAGITVVLNWPALLKR